jgi:hypothetical protein
MKQYIKIIYFKKRTGFENYAEHHKQRFLELDLQNFLRFMIQKFNIINNIFISK